MFLVGEGEHDIGRLAHGPSDDPWRPGEGGFLPPLLRGIAERANLQLEIRGQQYKALGRVRQIDEKDIRAHRARAAVALAVARGHRALVFVHDADSPRQRIDVAAVLRDALDGVTSLVAIPAAPMRTIEAWALGADDAYDKLSKVSPQADRAPRKPEKCWGRKVDQNSNHPKQVLRRCLGRVPHRGDFERLAANTDLERLKSRCPASLAPFVEECEAALRACTGGRVPLAASGRSTRTRR